MMVVAPAVPVAVMNIGFAKYSVPRTSAVRYSVQVKGSVTQFAIRMVLPANVNAVGIARSVRVVGSYASHHKKETGKYIKNPIPATAS